MINASSMDGIWGWCWKAIFPFDFLLLLLGIRVGSVGILGFAYRDTTHAVRFRAIVCLRDQLNLESCI
jgi:hypothetical protein